MSADKTEKLSILARLKKVKHIEIIIAVLFIAIILLIYFVGFPSTNSSDKTASTSPLTTTTFASYAQENENRLKNIVSSIKGAGKADVMINYESTPELVIAYVENKSDSSSSSSPSIISGGGSQSPIVIKELAPKIVGVLIIAEGADNATVKLAIINSVSTLLGITTDKIAVLTRA